MFLPFKDKLRYSALLNHPKHGRKVSAYQSFWTSNDALSIHRKGREIESAEKLTRKNEKQINHQNKPKSQNKLKKCLAMAVWRVYIRQTQTLYPKSCVYFSTTLIASNYGLMRDKLTWVSHWAMWNSLFPFPIECTTIQNGFMFL